MVIEIISMALTGDTEFYSNAPWKKIMEIWAYLEDIINTFAAILAYSTAHCPAKHITQDY